MAPVRIGLIGVRDGLPYLRACLDRDDVEVAAICDRETNQLGEVSRRFEIGQAVTDDDRLLARGDIDAVIITTPDPHHRKQIVAALKGGKHVYCTPPVTQTPEDCNSLCNVAAHYPNQRLMVGHTSRLLPFFRGAQQAIADGAIGRIYHLRVELHTAGSEYADTTTWRVDPKTGTPPLLGLGGAAIDMGRWLAGELISVQAWAERHALLRQPFSDTVLARYRTADGAAVEVFLAVGAHRPPSFSLEVLGTEGALNGAAGGRQNAYWHAATGELTRHDLPGDPTASAVANGLAEFVAAIREEREPAVTLADGIRVVAAAVAARRSAEQGGAPVELAQFDPTCRAG